MRKLTDNELNAMTHEEVYRHWQQLLNRADFEKYEMYGERLMYWMQNKRLAEIGLEDQPIPW
jgi:hypothetical protein